MQPTPAASRVKGSALLGYVGWFIFEHDVEALYSLIDQIPKEKRGALTRDSPTLGLISTGWYESEMAHQLLDALAHGLSPVEQTEVARRSAAYSVDLAVRGLFKMAFQLMGTPERYAKYIQRFWNQLHDSGVRTVEIVNPGIAISRIEDWPGHHPFLCELTTETMAAIFREMGCEDVQVTRVECVAHGDPRCRSVLRWDTSENG